MNSQDFRNLQEAYIGVYDDDIREKLEFESWVNNLLEEGYDLSDYTWDELYENYSQLDESGLSQDTIQRAVIARQKRNDAELAKDTPEGDAAFEKGWQKVKRSKSQLNINKKFDREGPTVRIQNEGIVSAIGGLFGKKKEPEAPKAPEPLSRGAELRRRYNTGPEKSNTSVKRAIIDRARGNASRAQNQVDRGNASQSYADNANNDVEKYLRAGYSKYGVDRSDSGGMGGSGGSGSGNKARKRAAALNNSYDLFDYMMEYLITEGYADTNENALVIMANMSEEWREDIMEISQKTATRAFAKRATNEFESDSDNPTDFTKSGKSKADETKRRVDRKFGKKAGEHAERAAHAGIFGRKSFSMPKKPN